MTLANAITLLRVLLVPVFVALAIYYAESAAAGKPDETLRFAAITSFALAAFSDLLDGWVARHFRQETRLGRILDPVADKLLLVSALLTLSLSAWPTPLPLWFVITCITREVLLATGAFVVDHVTGRLEVEPHWTGKLATLLQVIVVAASMLHFAAVVRWTAVAAAFFTILSGVLYLLGAGRQIKAAGSG